MKCRRLVVPLLLGLAVLAAPTVGRGRVRPWEEPQDTASATADGDAYAWRLFVALNWPADLAARSADRSARFGADRPVVWESWQNAGAVYLDEGADPGPWTTGSGGGGASAPSRRFETLSLQDFPNARHVVGGAMVPLVDPLAAATRLTEIRMNRTTFEFVRARELYHLDGQRRAFTAGVAVSFPYGSKEVKAKWRPIGEEERSRYHTLRVVLADGTERLYGLTALHIASKDLPNWFWATFEHVDNPRLPDAEGWKLPSRDRFACGAGPPDCNRAPKKKGLEGTVWQYYRLRGTLTEFVDHGRPQRLANSELETGLQETASCITCHSRSSIGVVGGETVRLPIFDSHSALPSGSVRRGFVGDRQASWFEGSTASGQRPRLFLPLDFVWSLANAKARPDPASVTARPTDASRHSLLDINSRALENSR